MILELTAYQRDIAIAALRTYLEQLLTLQREGTYSEITRDRIAMARQVLALLGSAVTA